MIENIKYFNLMYSLLLFNMTDLIFRITSGVFRF